jgi:hypothetical protein
MVGTIRRPTAGPMSSPNAPTVQYIEDFFIYGANFLALAPNVTANGGFQVQADSDFRLTKLGAVTDVAAAGQDDSTRVFPLATMQIVDTGSGQQLFSIPIPIGAIFGNGELPFILTVPRIFKARSNIAIAIANYDAAQTYNIRLAFIGNKIFTLGN